MSPDDRTWSGKPKSGRTLSNNETVNVLISTPAPAHTKDCPVNYKPPRKPGACVCGVARDKWLETARTLERAIRRNR